MRDRRWIRVGEENEKNWEEQKEGKRLSEYMVWKKSIFIKRNNKISKNQCNCWYFCCLIFQYPRWINSCELFDSYSHGALNIIWLVKNWAVLLLVLCLHAAIEFTYLLPFCFYWFAYLCFSEILLIRWVAWKGP